RIEGPQDLVDVPAHREIVDAHMANDSLRVDDEGRAQRYPILFVENTERSGQLALRVGEHRERQLLQVRMILSPGEVDVVRVGAGAEHLRVPVAEVRGAAAELRDLRRADEREVHRPEEDDL